MKIFLYGPSGSGKSAMGELLASDLGAAFFDLDAMIEARAGKDIPAIFEWEGEAGFRALEKAMLREIVENPYGVVALGGGALLDPESRELAEKTGEVLCLNAASETLLERLQHKNNRPLLAEDREERLQKILSERAEHYGSFAKQLDTECMTLEEATWEAQVLLGIFHLRGMGDYDVRVRNGILDSLGEEMRSRDLVGPITLVSDENVGNLYAEKVRASLQGAGYEVHEIWIQPGESNKNIEMVSQLWSAFAQERMERKSTVVALGGGVVGDLAGFAAATFLRGMPWVNLPTSLLAMVDASVGGKTGANLAQGKNLIGAFHAPRLVLASPATLSTLPDLELRNGLAETVKTGVIGDPELFELCAQGELAVRSQLEYIVRRAIAVKIKVIEEDPYETGLRETLNLGHTIGHAVEKVSDYKIHHGEAVSIGMVAEVRLSQALGLAVDGLADQLIGVLRGLNLPVEAPEGIDKDSLVAAMKMDKKRAGGMVRFSLPIRVGEVRTGIEVEAAEAIEFL
jgi:shikimate kinase/3-dehydroquinate synthase